MLKQSDNNLYSWAYNILTTALKPNDITEGMSKALYLVKRMTNADDVIIYKLEDNDEYIHRLNQPYMVHNSNQISTILNDNRSIIEEKKYYLMNVKLSESNNILFIPIVINNNRFVLTISNVKNLLYVNDRTIDLLIENFSIIIKEYETKIFLIKSAEIDALTGLNNRVSYEKEIAKNELVDGMIYGLLDLFRLKVINDDYSHEQGDIYIKESAQLLKKYFPQHIYQFDKNGKKIKVKTGTSLYRIGGDEFTIISTTEDYDSVIAKMIAIQEEVKRLDLQVTDPLRINYGITQRNNNETFRELYLKSDKLLSDNKIETYKSLELVRRK